jgi:hypothetical protein
MTTTTDTVDVDGFTVEEAVDPPAGIEAPVAPGAIPAFAVPGQHVPPQQELPLPQQQDRRKPWSLWASGAIAVILALLSVWASVGAHQETKERVEIRALQSKLAEEKAAPWFRRLNRW